MMETPPIQETTTPVASQPAPGVFGTKVPSVLAYGIGVLLFFMPFVDIKCNSMVLQKVSGVQLATGFKVRGPGSDNSLVGSFENMNERGGGGNVKTEKRSPNTIALLALGLGVASLVLALLQRKMGAFIAGILAAVALIATMVDVKSKLNSELAGSRGTDPFSGSRDYGSDFIVAVDFTGWFYLAVITFGLGAFFCHRWIRAK